MLATEVSGPGRVDRVGNGVDAHCVQNRLIMASCLKMILGVRTACSISLMVLPAGKNESGMATFGGAGMTSEQSIISSGFCPSCVSARKMNWKSLVSFVRLSAASCQHIRSVLEEELDRYALTKDCHSQAVRGSRAMELSDMRRSSPGSGDSTSPWLPPEPGKAVPRSWVSTKNWLSKIPGVESKGRPWRVGSTSLAAAIEWLMSRAL